MFEPGRIARFDFGQGDGAPHQTALVLKQRPDNLPGEFPPVFLCPDVSQTPECLVC